MHTFIKLLTYFHAGIAMFNPDKICANPLCSIYHWSVACACVQLMSLIRYLVFDVYMFNPAESIRFYNRDMHLLDIMLQMSVVRVLLSMLRETLSLFLSFALSVFLLIWPNHIYTEKEKPDNIYAYLDHFSSDPLSLTTLYPHWLTRSCSLPSCECLWLSLRPAMCRLPGP